MENMVSRTLDEPSQLRSVFLIYAHDITPRLLSKFAAARQQLAGKCDVHVIGYFQNPLHAPPLFKQDPCFHAFGSDDMAAFSFPYKGSAPFKLIPGNSDMLFLEFGRRFPHYDTFWVMEWDVEFTGDLGELISTFENSPSHLICTNIRNISPTWLHRGMNRWPAEWPQDPGLFGFMPFVRFSRELLTHLEKFYTEGGSGHYEYVWPSIATACKLPIEDFGGSGSYVKKGNRNRFYTSNPNSRDMFPGTFRYRPPLNRPGRRPNTLWHPVKDSKQSVSKFLYQRFRIFMRLLLLPRDRH